MDVEHRFQTIASVAEEILTENELRELLAEKTNPVAYDGFEPSSIAHLPFAVFRPLIIEELQKAGVKFKLFLADWHGWINNKMGGNLEAIQSVGNYFIEVWKAAGVKNVEYIWASDLVDSHEYWKKVILIAKHTTLARATRGLTIMGRKEGELKEMAQYFYPIMQTADIFELGVDICQLGLDQRRANIMAREVGPKLGWNKPVVVSHHMLMGLGGAKEPEGYEENKTMDIQISSKMSKSKPSTAVFIHDSTAEIEKKIETAFCPVREINNNPVIDYTKHIIFRKYRTMKIERPLKFGGDITYTTYQDLESDYASGKLHPSDLKRALAAYLDEIIAPLRRHFETNAKARELLTVVKKQDITR